MTPKSVNISYQLSALSQAMSPCCFGAVYAFGRCCAGLQRTEFAKSTFAAPTRGFLLRHATVSLGTSKTKVAIFSDFHAVPDAA